VSARAPVGGEGGAGRGPGLRAQQGLAEHAARLECLHVHAGGLSDALMLGEQRTHACYVGRARGASAALPLDRSAACRWNHPERPADELTRTERWCPLSVAWKRAACSAACSRGAWWVEAASGTPKTSREYVHASPGAAFQRAELTSQLTSELTQDPLRSRRELAPRANEWDSQGATHTTGKRSAPANCEERQQQPPPTCWHARRVGRPTVEVTCRSSQRPGSPHKRIFTSKNDFQKSVSVKRSYGCM
jgi:hypothetical protein